MGILDTLSALPPYAYSLRSLTSTYTGDVGTVKRASDSTTMSFAQMSGTALVSEIEAFCDGSQGTWIELFNHGSSGAAGNLSVASPGVFPLATNASGVCVTQKGLPAISFPGPGTSNAGFVSGATFSVWHAATSANFVFAESSQSNDGAPLLGGNAATLDTVVVWAGDSFGGGGVRPAVLCAGNNSTAFDTSIPITVPNILTFSAPALSGGDLTVSGWLNSATMGTASVTGVTGTAPTGFSLGLDIFQESGTAFEGTMTEVVLWNSVISTADREALEQNQGETYGVAGFTSAAGTIFAVAPKPKATASGTSGTASGVGSATAPKATAAASGTSGASDGVVSAIAPLPIAVASGFNTASGTTESIAPLPIATAAGTASAAMGSVAALAPVPKAAASGISGGVAGVISVLAPTPTAAVTGAVTAAGIIVTRAPLPVASAAAASGVATGVVAATAPAAFASASAQAGTNAIIAANAPGALANGVGSVGSGAIGVAIAPTAIASGVGSGLSQGSSGVAAATAPLPNVLGSGISWNFTPGVNVKLPADIRIVVLPTDKRDVEFPADVRTIVFPY
jgi:hypothetical protein